MSEEQDKFRAADARALLDNTIFKEAFEKVGAHIEGQALGCDPDNKERTQRIILAKQILASIHREIVKVVENGIIADIRLAQIEKQNTFTRVFKR